MQHAPAELGRVPRAMEVEDPPPAKQQQLDELLHVPYQPWCTPCVCSKACCDKPERSSAGTRPSTLCIRFGFGYKKQGEPKMIQKKSAITSLVLADSASGYVHITPLRGKNEWNLMAQELLRRAGILGHSELTFRCDKSRFCCNF